MESAFDDSTRIEAGWEWLNRLVTSDTFVYVVKRLLQALLTLLLASALIFIIQLAPGDYLDTLKQNQDFARTD